MTIAYFLHPFLQRGSAQTVAVLDLDVIAKMLCCVLPADVHPLENVLLTTALKV